jgi:UDP-glucose 4-epimerase
MKIIITGGAGFIGSHLVKKLLEKKHEIIVIDNFSTGRKLNIDEFKNKIKFIRGDISKKGKWLRYFTNVKAVYHLAALADIVPSIQNPDKYFAANVVGTKNILNACILNKVPKIIYSASSSCYGIPKEYPTSEKEEIDPRYPYALTKRIAEELILHYAKIYNLKAVSLRLFNVYGTKSRTSGTYGAMFGVFLKQKIESKPLTVVGDGNQKRDFTYVSDIVNAFYKCLSYKGKINIFNVGTGKAISINKIVKLLKCKKIKIPKRPGEPDITHADIKLIKKELNWKPQIKIEDGINLILKEIKYWKKAPLWTPSKIKIATTEWFKYIK